MSCEGIRPQITALLEGRLGGPRARMVREHLAACTVCAARLSPSDRAELLPILDEVVRPSDSLDERFCARLAAHRAARTLGQRPLVERWRALATPPRLAVAGVLATVLVAVVVFTLKLDPGLGPAANPGDYGVAENLPLLQDMDVVQNLDLLEDLDAIQALDEGKPKPEVH